MPRQFANCLQLYSSGFSLMSSRDPIGTPRFRLDTVSPWPLWGIIAGASLVVVDLIVIIFLSVIFSPM